MFFSPSDFDSFCNAGVTVPFVYAHTYLHLLSSIAAYMDVVPHLLKQVE